MNASTPFPIEPWRLRETRLELGQLAHSESLFALSNGYVGVRGTLEEGQPAGVPGCYLNGVHERRTLRYPEMGYGYPAIEQRVVHVTDGTRIRFLVDGEPFDLRGGRLHRHQRLLDLRTGVLERTVDWSSPSGRTVSVRSHRLVSVRHRAVVALRYTIEAVDAPVRITLYSDLVANDELPDQGGDPQAASDRQQALRPVHSAASGPELVLTHRVPSTGLLVAAAVWQRTRGGQVLRQSTSATGDLGRQVTVADLAPGQVLELTKYVGYAWSDPHGGGAAETHTSTDPSPTGEPVMEPAADTDTETVTQAAVTAVAAAADRGWGGLLRDQRERFAEFWDTADVQVDGDPALQQAVRFGLFHVFQAAALAGGRAIPAKGLTGPGYEGHSFWDTETFVLPVLTHTAPALAADALRWRHATLPDARARASQLRLRGAAFPWRTITGPECSGYWPAGTAAFHLNADIADAVLRHLDATGDREFERDVAVDLLVETARLWRSLGREDAAGRFRIDGVTGPDEYSAVANNNLYTNLMAQRNLWAAAEIVGRQPERAAALGVDGAEIAAWRRAADEVVIPYDEALGVHQQAEGFTDQGRWDFTATGPGQYPLIDHFPYFDLYRRQVVKQADLVLAMHLRGDAFTPEQKRRNLDYYEPLTVRDSSLSACTQAVLAAEVGYLRLAYDYASEAALVDLTDLRRSTADGLHIASLAGSWIALVAGFGGLRDRGGRLCFRPRLPPGLDRLAFALARGGGGPLRVVVRPNEATYTVERGTEPVVVVHHDREVTLAPGAPTTLPIPPLEEPAPAPSQPPHRGACCFQDGDTARQEARLSA